jgi:1,4-dihydroxy-6-naphthoate synthase
MNISLAHSPDADDIFMYYAIAFGWVDTMDYNITNEALDIETLNIEAIKGTYDITAISFGMYPQIKDEYALLRTAVSFGEGYGPKLVRKKTTKLKRNFKVALSGANTTNAMLFRIFYPDARVVYKNFLEIEDAVLSGEVDAGVLIHESILNYNESLEVEKELWDIWLELSGGGLPLPLGGMALRRSIPLNRAIEIEQILIEGVKVANERKAELSSRLESEKLVRIDGVMLERYLDMYASSDSITLSDIQLQALDKLFEIGHKSGYYHEAIRAENYLIPTQYATLRNS